MPYTLTIYNNIGTFVHSGFVYPWFTNQYVECGTWANGVYVTQLKSKDGVTISSNKIVVLH